MGKNDSIDYDNLTYGDILSTIKSAIWITVKSSRNGIFPKLILTWYLL